MKYQIIDGTSREQDCTPELAVWVFNTNSTIEWKLSMVLVSTNYLGTPNRIVGTIRKAIMPQLTYTLNIITKTNTVDPIRRMQFETLEAATDYAQTFIDKVLETEG